MTSKLLLCLFIFIGSACQVGKIPCPRMKTVKLHKSFKPSSSLLTAKANQAEETPASRGKEQRLNLHYIQNISVEEWDCPKPGSKHYMPKSIKENIRRNRKKLESDFKKSGEAESDPSQ